MVAKIICCCFPFNVSLLLSICVVCVHVCILFICFYLFFIYWKFVFFLSFGFYCKGAGCFNRWNNLFGFLSVSIRFQIIEFCYRFHGSQLNNNNNWSLSSDNLFGIDFGAPNFILLSLTNFAHADLLDHRRRKFRLRSMLKRYSNSMIENKKFLTTHNSIDEQNLYSALNIEHSRNWMNPIFEQFPTEHLLMFSCATNHL